MKRKTYTEPKRRTQILMHKAIFLRMKQNFDPDEDSFGVERKTIQKIMY